MTAWQTGVREGTEPGGRSLNLLVNSSNPRRRLPVGQHAAAVLDTLRGAQTRTETVPLKSALGRVLAADQVATLPVPPSTDVDETAQPRDLVLERGTRLRARHLAAAAAAGLATLPVARRPRVRVVVTGDEVVAPGAPPRPGSVPDSDGPYVSGAVIRAGAKVAGLTRCPDDAEALTHVLDTAAADLVVVTGGISAPGRDAVRDVLEARGCELVDVVMHPEAPQGCGLWDGTPVVALPGDPTGVVVSFAVFVRPAIEALLGQTPRPPRWGVAAHRWHSPAGRRQYLPVVVTHDPDGRRFVWPASEYGSSAHPVACLAVADALAVVPEEQDEVLEGDVLPLLDLP